MDMFSIGLEVGSLLVTAFVLAGLVMCRIEMKGVKKLYIALILHMCLVLADLIAKTYVGEAQAPNIYLVMVALECPIMSWMAFAVHCYIAEKFVDDSLLGLAYTWGPAALYLLIDVFWISSFKTGMLFTQNEAGFVFPGPYFILGLVGIYLFFLVDLIFMIIGYVRNRVIGFSLMLYCMYLILPLIVLLITFVYQDMFPLYAAFSFSYLLVYIFHHNYEVKCLKNNIEDAVEERIQLVISQLQPHFIINSLTTAKYLCSENPKYAEMALTKISGYFKNNIDMLQSEDLISVKKELSHAQTYLWLEQLRFGESLRVELSTEDVDFDIPPLTLQPLIENAVKHGVCKNEEGGTVAISVVDEDDFYKIMIKDDGNGFDADKLYREEFENGSIAVIKKRLSNTLSASLKVTSKIGIGTTVEITIPK